MINEQDWLTFIHAGAVATVGLALHGAAACLLLRTGK
jgi:hypothetical protein